MSSRFRVCKYKKNGFDLYEIRECFYNKKDQLCGLSKRIATATDCMNPDSGFKYNETDCIASITEQLQKQTEALSRPILDIDNVTFAPWG